mmetsp:Transcript_17958/g.61699  ORF Transcript_17958/g.61699 Transcript_17958/m.61699 type:complete len:343 (-) Transcript_17958:6-1034(-)
MERSVFVRLRFGAHRARPLARNARWGVCASGVCGVAFSRQRQQGHSLRGFKFITPLRGSRRLLRGALVARPARAERAREKRRRGGATAGRGRRHRAAGRERFGRRAVVDGPRGRAQEREALRASAEPARGATPYVGAAGLQSRADDRRLDGPQRGADAAWVLRLDMVPSYPDHKSRRPISALDAHLLSPAVDASGVSERCMQHRLCRVGISPHHLRRPRRPRLRRRRPARRRPDRRRVCFGRPSGDDPARRGPALCAAGAVDREAGEAPRVGLRRFTAVVSLPPRNDSRRTHAAARAPRLEAAARAARRRPRLGGLRTRHGRRQHPHHVTSRASRKNIYTLD